MRDVSEACVYGPISQLKVYYKSFYSISAAVHNRIVRARPKEQRRIRENPRLKERMEWQKKQQNCQGEAERAEENSGESSFKGTIGVA